MYSRYFNFYIFHMDNHRVQKLLSEKLGLYKLSVSEASKKLIKEVLKIDKRFKSGKGVEGVNKDEFYTEFGDIVPHYSKGEELKGSVV